MPTPEEKARQKIDAMLVDGGWVVSAGCLLASLLSPPVKGLIDRVAISSHAEYLREGDEDRLPIRLSPLVKQHRIVVEFERRLSVIEDLEDTVEANLNRPAPLRQAVLVEAFSGRLLPGTPISVRPSMDRVQY